MTSRKAPAVIFDGVLSDTERLHAEVKSRIVEERFSIHLSVEEVSERFAGMMEAVMFRRLVEERNLPYDDAYIRLPS